jgi:2'-phosphotransferase
MARNHIHFAVGEIGESGVVSGMRSSAQIKIYVNVALAMSAGIPFYLSKNSVVLTPGIDGVLPAQFFSRVVDAHSGEEISLMGHSAEPR